MWSIAFVGLPEKVASAVEAYALELSGDNRAEYEKVAPTFASIIRQNHANGGAGYVPRLIVIRASGSAAKDKDGTPLTGTVRVTIENIDAQPV
jgi:hypothetical protein